MENLEINIMEKMNIKKLALKTSLPMIISMISIALYGIIDTMFVSNIGEKALAAISLAYPIQTIITAIPLGFGIGINSLLARTYGEKNEERTYKIIKSGIVLIFLSWILIALFSLICIKPFFRFFSNNEQLISLGRKYLFITSFFSIGLFYQILFEKILEANGKTKESMILQIVGAVINLILDPILIFGAFKLPTLGISGAAIATVIGQLIGMTIGIFFIIKYKIFKFSEYINIKIEKNIIKEIFKVGIPTIILEMATSFITLIINKILINFSDLQVSLWGIYTRIQKFIIIIIYGLNYGMIPIIAYNFGAKRKDRIKEAIKFFLELSICVTFVGMMLFLIIPDKLISIFNVSEELINIGKPAFRILSLGFIFSGISLVFSGIFQSLGNATYSLIINLLRKIIIAIPIIIIFKNIFGVSIIWWAFTIAEIITTLVSIILYKNIYNTKINKI